MNPESSSYMNPANPAIAASFTNPSAVNSSRTLTIFASFPTCPLTDCMPHGDGLLANDLIRRLAARGHTVHVATPKAVLRKGLPMNVFLYQHEPGRNKLTIASKLRYALWCRLLLNRLRRQIAFDLVHELNPLFPGLSLAFAGIDVPVVLGPTSSTWPADADQLVSSNPSTTATLQERFKKRLAAVQYAQASAVLMTSAAALNNVPDAAKFAGRLFLLPPAIEDSLFAPKPVTSPERTILFFANLNIRKGVYTLLDAFDQLAPHLPDVKLILAGSGSTDQLAARIANSPYRQRIELLGPVARPDVPIVMNRASVYCLPSHGEPFGISALEAMACGKAVVATNAGGLGCLVPEAGGRRVPVRDPIALAEALIDVLSTPGLCEEMGQYNRWHVEKHYTWDRIIKRLEAVYATVSDSHKQHLPSATRPYTAPSQSEAA